LAHCIESRRFLAQDALLRSDAIRRLGGDHLALRLPWRRVALGGDAILRGVIFQFVLPQVGPGLELLPLPDSIGG